MKRLTRRWGSEPYPNLAGRVVCEYKECDSAKSCNILPVLYLSPAQGDKIEGGERGDNGFGSTGR